MDHSHVPYFLIDFTLVEITFTIQKCNDGLLIPMIQPCGLRESFSSKRILRRDNMCNPSWVMNMKMNYSMMSMCSRKSMNEHVYNKSMNPLGKKGEKRR